MGKIRSYKNTKKQKGLHTMQNNDEKINLTDDKTIDLFIVGLMDEKGISYGDEPYKTDIFQELKTRLLTELDRAMVAALPDDKLDEFSKIVAKDGKINPDVVAKAVVDAGVNVEEVAGTTMAKFREIYLNGAAENEEA